VEHLIQRQQGFTASQLSRHQTVRQYDIDGRAQVQAEVSRYVHESMT
jgi:hypothetical protein